MTLGGGYGRDAWRAQYASIGRTIRAHGLATPTPPYPARDATVKEKLYTK
jgi:hypothetical protein